MQDPSGLNSLWIWLENTSIAVSLRQSIWLYPSVEIVHIVGFAILVGAAILYDMRLLGFSKRIPVIDASNYLAFWAKLSFIAIVPSGVLLFMVDASSYVSNIAFQLKLIFLFAAIVNAVIFQLFTFKSVDKWNHKTTTPLGAKVAAILSIIFWVMVISGGRFIAYM
jgi:hypothetical protein